MIAVLQRASSSEVKVDGVTEASCGYGLVLLIGVASGDAEIEAELLANKISKLRVFCDETGKMNLSVKDIGGEVLAVPNFTLLGSYKKGNRPDYTPAAPPDEARRLFEYFCGFLARTVSVKRGVFGADMKLNVRLDGPVTLCLDSKTLKK